MVPKWLQDNHRGVYWWLTVLNAFYRTDDTNSNTVLKIGSKQKNSEPAYQDEWYLCNEGGFVIEGGAKHVSWIMLPAHYQPLAKCFHTLSLKSSGSLETINLNFSNSASGNYIYRYRHVYDHNRFKHFQYTLIGAIYRKASYALNNSNKFIKCRE